ncbi:ATP-binding protein [Persicobacter psychrovividus]|uniref:histidine kinase n=1 Tax=Persicobacter psychrovividus TaxID=387638 RepID=A0ABM7VMP7_9BACT|nr:hypothetical protein PEPS_45350 [Persicobacter psychrovividus]
MSQLLPTAYFKNFKLSNTIALLLIGLIFPYIWFFHAGGASIYLSLFCAVMAVLFSGVIALNYFEKVTWAKFLTILFSTVTLSTFSMTFGGESLLFIYFFALVLMPIMFFSFEQKLLIVASYLCIFSGLITDTVYKVIAEDKMMTNELMWLIIGNICFCFILMSAYCYLIVRQKYHFNESLHEQNIELESTMAHRKAVEQELIDAREKAEEVSQAKENFLSSMSHELRTPLNAVIGITNLLIGATPRKDQIDNLNIMKFSADNLLMLINDILDYNKIIAGKMEIEAIPFNLADHLRKIKDSNAFKAAEQNNQINLLIGESVPATIISDPVRIVQVMNNLISNAIKFTENGNIDIRIFNPEPSLPGKITFEVQDQGIGISAENLGKIFKDFEQAESSTNRRFGGTGLGLPISKKLLQLMGSDMEVESEEGKGTKFFFTLEVEVTQEIFSVEKQRKEAVHNSSPLEGCRVLVVEDNLINVKVACQFLKKWGVIYEVAEDGQVAVEKTQQSVYDLILMDLHMPVMNGYEATAQIRTFNTTIPIIALTASAMVEVQQKVLSVGMNASVTKPFVPEVLKSTMISQLRDRQVFVEEKQPQEKVADKKTT